MPSAVTCGDCGAQFEVTQQLWDDQIGGKLVHVCCKRCGAKMELDGRDAGAAPRHSKPPPPNAREKLTSATEIEPDGIREETPTVPLTKPDQLPAPGKLPVIKVAVTDQPTEKSAAHAEATQTAGPNDPWLVSYADDDDRELTTSAVEAAFRDAKIHTETLIWRDGMDEWLAISEVEAFADLFKPAPATDQTGGFLGTGLGLGVGSGGPTINSVTTGTEADDDAAPISLMPDSLPPESLDPDSVEPKLVALSAGTMAETKPKGPPPRREHTADSAIKPGGVKLPTPKIAKDALKAAEAPHIKRLPKPPATPLAKTGYLPSQPSNPQPEADTNTNEKPHGKSTPRPPVNLKRPPTVAFEEEAPALDSIPDVAALSRMSGPATQETQGPKPEDLPLTGSVDLGLGVSADTSLAPTIKVDDLETDVDAGDAAEADDSKTEAASHGGADAADLPVSSKRRKKKRSTQSGPSSANKIREEILSDAPVARSKAPAAMGAAASAPPAEDSAGSKTPLYIALGLAAAFALYWFGIRDSAPPEEPKQQAVATQTAKPTADTPSADSPSTADLAATAEPVAEPGSDKPTEPAPDATAADHTATSKPLGTAATPAASTAPKPTTTATAEAAKPTGEKPAEPAAKPTAKPPPEEPTSAATAPFDVGAARAALASAAAAASSCRKPGDPSGVAQVTITFVPSGRATNANISGPPFAGTATGGCIAGMMRGARVPPFVGTAKTVSKTVVIN